MRECLDENEAAAFADGLLAREEALAIEAHIDACSACRELVSAAAFGLADASTTGISTTHGHPVHDGDRLTRGAPVGRYLVLDYVGAGAMGVVYSAYDPQLDRRVALKLHRAAASGSGSEERERLLREARTMAQLGHAHVVAVYDAGLVDERAFIAMQLVQGCSLKEWLKSGERGWRAILEVMRKAGAGLSAAHQAGIVHRDFKPENVLIDQAGSPRVSDFGLARAEPLADGEAAPIEGAATMPAATRGALRGTPAYMAPEQLAGEPATARSDQFAFCVTLYEALFGERPFAGETVAELREAISLQRLRPLASRSSVPRWLQQALLRGLAADPAARYASMDELLKAIGGRRNAQMRWAATAFAALLITSGLAAYVVRERAPSCADTAQAQSDLWSDARREELSRAFEAARPELAQAALNGVERAFVSYLGRWRSEATAACESARAGGAPAELHLARQDCLQRRLFAVRALLYVLANANSQAVERAVHAANDLPGFEACIDATALLAERPRDPAREAELQSLEETVARAFALVKTGQYKDALEVAHSGKPGSDPKHPLAAQARLLLWQGTSESRLAQSKLASETLRQAALQAERNRDAETAVRAYVELVYVNAILLDQGDIGQLYLDQAEASLSTLEGHDELAGTAERAHAWLATRRNSMEEALAHNEQALKLFERSVGPEHPVIPKVLSDIGSEYTYLGRSRDAAAVQERALAVATRAFGANHPDLGSIYNNLANAYLFDAQFEKALETNERAWALRRSLLGEGHPLTASSLSNMGEVLYYRGRHREAREKLQEAVRLLRSAYGDKHPRLGIALSRLGKVLIALGESKAAAESMENTLAIVDASDAPDPGMAGDALLGLGELQFARGRYNEALRLALRAGDVLRQPNAMSGDLGRALLFEARVRWAMGHDRDRAIDVARQAKESLGDCCNPFVVERQAVAEFLNAHAPASL